MRRREFISALGVATASSLLIDGASPARAEAPGRVYRLGHLANTAASEALSRDVLLPELARLGFVLGRNLDLIESAIDESRAAISTEPGSAVAQDSLLEALRRKVTLLQQTILLINEVRKGQGENAMDIIDEMREGAPPSNPI